MHVRTLALASLALSAAVPAAGQELPPVQTLTVGGFAIEHGITVQGPPEEVFDAITGDLRPWWDHHYSEQPVALYMDPVVGGCFCEVMDSAGATARHAVVTYVKRGEMLRFEGPLGLAGNAITMVHTYEFAAQGDSTRVTLKVRGFGELQPGWPEAVNGVWHHFLVQQFKGWYDAGGHRGRPRWAGPPRLPRE